MFRTVAPPWTSTQRPRGPRTQCVVSVGVITGFVIPEVEFNVGLTFTLTFTFGVVELAVPVLPVGLVTEVVVVEVVDVGAGDDVVVEGLDAGAGAAGVETGVWTTGGGVATTVAGGVTTGAGVTTGVGAVTTGVGVATTGGGVTTTGGGVVTTGVGVGVGVGG